MRHTSSNENVCYFVVIELIVRLLSDVRFAARSKSKQKRLIRPDGEHFCQNLDIQRGIPAVRDFKVTSALLTNI